MFKQGTLLKVVASSHNTNTSKKTIGAKRGSLCFFSNSITSYTDKSKNCIFILVNIVYIKYGLEEKYRLEKKQAIILMPLVNPPSKNVKNHTKCIIKKLNQGKFESIRTHLVNYYNLANNCPIIMLSEYFAPRTALLTSNYFIFRAWIESCSIQGKFIDILYRYTSVNKNKSEVAWLSREWIANVRQLITDQSYRTSYIKLLYDDKQNMEMAIKTIQYLLQLKDVSDIKELISYYSPSRNLLNTYEKYSHHLMKLYILNYVAKRYNDLNLFQLINIVNVVKEEVIKESNYII